MIHPESQALESVVDSIVGVLKKDGRADDEIRTAVTVAVQKACSFEDLPNTDHVNIGANLFRSVLGQFGLDRRDAYLQERWLTTARRAVDRKLYGGGEDPTSLGRSWREQLEDKLQPLLQLSHNPGGEFVVSWETEDLGADELGRIASFKGSVNAHKFCGIRSRLLKFVGFRQSKLPNGKICVKYAFALLFTSEHSHIAMNFDELPG
jgi:hypothetical protein